MSNEEMFYKLCENMAHLEDVLKTLESIGLNVEPDEGIGFKLFNTCSSLYRIASYLLECPDVQTDDEVCNELLAANSDTVFEISRRIWSQYGKKPE
jgi:hypothetical protein